MIEARHYCRKCRVKLPEPVENEHHAFCTKACYDQFYRKRCLACEKPLRTARRSFCPKPAKCANLVRTWPQITAEDPSEMPILRASNSASEATFLPPIVFASGGGAIRSRATSPSTTRMG
jgi:hypothetical protein